MKVIVTYSGGKDSQASLLWTLEKLTRTPIVVFCDTGWEHPLTYKHIEGTMKALGLELITLRSKKYDGMVDMSTRRKRFPSTYARFCTGELKTMPMLDYVLDQVRNDFIIIQGIRAAKSASRAAMASQCNYFKYYLEPYGTDKHGKPKYHTYRRREVLAYCKQHATDVLRPVFEWSGHQVIDYIIEKGQQPNPLYKMGYKRVGCYPCIMSSQQDILNIIRQDPERISEIA